MAFWDWLFSKSNASMDSELAIQLQAEKDKNSELRQNLTKCLSEKSYILEEARKGIKVQHDLDIKITDLTQALKIAEKNILEYENKLARIQQEIYSLAQSNLELKATCDRGLGTIDNLTKQRNALEQLNFQIKEEIEKLKKHIEITPEILQAFLISKYPQGTDVSKVWDDFAEAVTNAFAIILIDPVIEISGAEFRDSVLKAFPGIRFNSMLMDSRYFCPSCADIIRVIRNNWGDLKPYVPERGDCNWFAERLRVHFNNVYLLNIGIVVVGPAPFGLHSWSIIKGSDGIVVCEPQNDSVTIIPEKLPGYIEQEVIIA